TLAWKRVPGLAQFVGLGGVLRGMLATETVIYACVGDKVVTVTRAGVVTVLDGTVPGDGLVTFAKNRRIPGDVVLVADYGSYWVDGNVVRTYPDGDLPFVGSVTFLDGFFLFTTDDGVIWASE